MAAPLPGRLVLSRRGFLGALGTAAAAAWLTGCTPSADDGTATAPTTTPGSTPTVRDRALSGSTAPADVRVGLILGPPSMGLSRFILAAQAQETYSSFEVEVTGVDYATLAARFNQGDFDIVTLPANLGAVLANNDDITTEVAAISIGNLGVLHVVTTDPDVTELADLAGRTVYAIGEGGTPEYTLAAVLAGHGLRDAVQVSFRPTPFEVLNLLQQEERCVAVLPQPFVELARTMVPSLTVPVDLTEEWARTPAGAAGSQAVTTHTLVNRQFLAEHEVAVVEYLQRVGESVDYTLDHVAEAAAVQEQLGTFLNDEVAARAIPFCSIVNLTGEVMYRALHGFLQVLHDQDPASIGGAMPDADFYYMPPAGALDVDVRTLVAQQPAASASAG
jgi:NitT/TauT family transport system substrate-binding protein